MACKIIEDFVVKSSFHRPCTKLKSFRGVTIHETGNSAKGATAKSHNTYYHNMANANTPKYIGYHYFVDDTEAYLEHPLDEIAWTNGDGNGDGNMKTVSVEICVNSDGDFIKARDNGAYVAAVTLYKHGIKSVIDGVSNNEQHKKDGTANLFQHWNWSSYRKNCPEQIRTKGLWNELVIATQKHLNELWSNKTTASTNMFAPYKIKVVDTTLNVRKDAGINNPIVTTIKKGGVYTIIEEKNVGTATWGKLKSGVGWINIGSAYVKKV